MENYDINNPTDIMIMESEFDSYTFAEWDAYIEFVNMPEHKSSFSFNDFRFLNTAKKRSGWGNKLTPKQLVVILALIDRIEDIKNADKLNQTSEDLFDSGNFNIPASNVTLRVAWHDNKWDGSVCNDPINNTYCNGFRSLLSERIRKRKADNIDSEISNKGKSLSEINYMPPCFWSINLFGSENIDIKHDNPAAPNLKLIEDKLSPNSMLSWPFSVSFTRSKKERDESGAYPRNLENVRIPRFNAKMQEDATIAFMYANFSNPITEEEQKYLVVGAGILDSKEKASEIKHFRPSSEIEKIKQGRHKYRNFPSMNWAMRFSFDPHLTIRMPYHEYLEASEELDDDSKDKFLDDIKVVITEPEIEWCFKYVAMDIGDDEAIYILTKMRKALLTCKDDGIVTPNDMQERIKKVEGLLKMAWLSRSYFPGFISISRVLLNQQDEPEFSLESFYNDFKQHSKEPDKELEAIILNPSGNNISANYKSQFRELKDRIDQRGFTIEQFLYLSMLNLRHFQFRRILDGKLKLSDNWIRSIDNDLAPSHDTVDIINNPYLLYEDYDYWSDSHDDVYGEDLDSPIDLFKIDIAFFPDTRFNDRIDLQRKMGFVDKRRIRALIIRHLNILENTGDCFSNADELHHAMSSYALYYEIGEKYQLPKGLFHPVNSEYANHFQDEHKKLVLVEANDTTYYYLTKVYEAEKNVEGKLSELLRGTENQERYPALEEYINQSIVNLKETIGESFEHELFRKERKNLYENIFNKKLFIVSGSAGSGKSYEVLNIINHLENHERQNYLLLAPTGKAALRLSADHDFSNIKASTIDKFIFDTIKGKISIAEIKQYKNVIIDEMSMVDLLKFEKLLGIFNFMEPSFKRLILIGDPNQLPAIGFGRVLADLISYLRIQKSYQNNYIQLETNCRSELKDNEVLKLAEAFKQKGELEPNLGAKFKAKETNISQGFKTRYWSTRDELYQQIEEEFERLTFEQKIDGNLSSKLNQVFGLSADGKFEGRKSNIENFQILTPYNGQYSGTGKINDFIQNEFKKNDVFQFRKNVYKKADKLIRTKNYYNKDNLLLSNGTLGFIMDKSDEKFYFESSESMEKISFSGIRAYDKDFFDLAYAITVHKAQGSGFNHLFLILPARYGLLSKELVYTALTRTKKSITLFLQTNDEKQNTVLDIALGRSFSAGRRTSLMLDKPYRFYDLEPEPGVFVESRVELLIYHLLMKMRDKLGNDNFNFGYENKPFVDGKEINIKTDFTIFCNNKVWYWEHLGLLGQRKYEWIWKTLKKKTYQDAGIWDNIITTDETNGIQPSKIEQVLNNIIKDNVLTEDKHNKYSNHHYYLR